MHKWFNFELCIAVQGEELAGPPGSVSRSALAYRRLLPTILQKAHSILRSVHELPVVG